MSVDTFVSFRRSFLKLCLCHSCYPPFQFGFNFALTVTVMLYICMLSFWLVMKLFLVCVCPSTVYIAMRNNLGWRSFLSMQRYSHYIAPMDPQVCPPPLSSSQSVISGLDKSPASTFRPGHSRSSSTGSGKHSKQVKRKKDTNYIVK